jgi:hypothetical protein
LQVVSAKKFLKKRLQLTEETWSADLILRRDRLIGYQAETIQQEH